MRWSRRLILGLVFGLVISYIGLVSARSRVNIIFLDQGRSIVFFNDWYEVDSCLRRFQIRGKFFQVVQRAQPVQFCDDPPHNAYRLLTDSSGDIVGVIDQEMTNPLILMYDVKRGYCWPCGGTVEQRDELFRKLKATHPDLQR